MLQNTRKTLGFKKIMVYKIPPGGGKPYLATGLKSTCKIKSTFDRCTIFEPGHGVINK